MFDRGDYDYFMPTYIAFRCHNGLSTQFVIVQALTIVQAHIYIILKVLMSVKALYSIYLCT